MGNIEEFIAGYWNTVPLLISFAGGIIAFLSPCTLPLLPVYISYISGVGIKEEIDGKKRLKMVLSTLAFVIGFTIIFVLMAIVVSYFGNIARKILYNDILYKIVGILVIIMGIQMTGIFKFRFLNREKKIELNFKKRGYLISMFLGMAFAVGWSPCTGPILGSVLALAATSTTVYQGIFYLIAFSLGLGIPFLIIGFFMDYFTKIIKKSGKVVSIISVVSGVILIIMGVILFFNKLSIIAGLI
jgi:cytochrome c-type biogenesis protein